MIIKAKIQLVYIGIIITILEFLKIKCYRYEPFNIWKSRYNFYNDLFKSNNNITKSLKLSYNHKEGFYCKVKKEIKENDVLFSIPSYQAISLFDDYPFKKSLYSLLNDIEFNDIGYLNKDLINNILLSLRIVFEIKGNNTASFIEISKLERDYNSTNINKTNIKYTNNNNLIDLDINLNNYRRYLKFKNNNDILYKYYSMLPLQYMYSQMAFYNNGDLDYSKSGHVKPIKSLLERVYITICNIIDNFINKNENKLEDNDYTKKLYKKYGSLFKVIFNWFNVKNLYVFKSAYAFVSSRSFKHNLSNYIDNSNNHENRKLNEDIANNIIKQSKLNYNNNSTISLYDADVPYLLPSIDLCNHYHPKLINANLSNINNYNNSILNIKQIKVKSDNTNNKYIVSALNSYNSQEEFSFTYSKILTNDYLLLNYGFVIQNNEFQEYIFRFDLEDTNKKLFFKLKENKFNMDLVTIKKSNLTFHEENADITNTTNNYILSIHFSLNNNELNEELYRFIELYVNDNNLFNYTNTKYTSNKVFQSLNNSIMLKIYNMIIYYRAIEKNIRDIFDSNLSIKAKNMTTLINEINENINTIEELQIKIDKDENTISSNNNKLFNELDLLIKTNNILIFHKENIKILMSHQIKILDIILSYYLEMINKSYLKEKNSIKLNYINL